MAGIDSSNLGGSINLGVQSPEQLGQQPKQPGAPGTQGPGQSSFDKVLQQQNQDPTAITGQNPSVQNLQSTQNTQITPNQPNAPIGVSEQAQQASLQKSRDVSQSQIGKEPSKKVNNNSQQPSGLRAVLGVWTKDQGAMDNIMKLAVNNQNLSPSQMVALQAATFQVTFEMNAFGKAATEASQSLKTLMTQQV